MEGLFFKSGSSVIETKSYEDLDNVAIIMLAHPKYKLQISGYTDNTGIASSNFRLSKARVAAAIAYLIKDRVDASSMTSEGYGIADPRATNDTPEGRALSKQSLSLFAQKHCGNFYLQNDYSHLNFTEKIFLISNISDGS